MAEASGRRARAFAPGHVTGFFAPRLTARDPRARGSIGAGFVLAAGVTADAEWTEATRSSIRLTSLPRSRLEISRDVARRLVGDRQGRLSVRLVHELPLGQGFGSSASGALATALATAAVLGVPKSRAVDVAHLADLFGRGGLGGVSSILGGGVEVRVRPGVPPYGRAIHTPGRGNLIVGTVGPRLRSAPLLSGKDWESRFAEGEDLLREVARAPSAQNVWAASERFTDRVGLGSPRLRALLRGTRERGAKAAQAMFGNSFVVSVPPGSGGLELRRWLTPRTGWFREVRMAREGASVLGPGEAGPFGRDARVF